MYSPSATHSVVRSEGRTLTDRSTVVMPDPVMDGHDVVVNKPAVTRLPDNRENASGDVVASAAEHLKRLGRSVAEAIDSFGRAGESRTAT